MERLSYELDVTKGIKRIKPKKEKKSNEIDDETFKQLNQPTNEIRKSASQRLKFRDTNFRKPSSDIDLLERLTQRQIDLYYRPTHPVTSKQMKDGIKRTQYLNGDVSIEYKDGTFRIQRQHCENIYFFNGDIEQKYDDGFVVHQYESNGAIDAVVPSGITYIVFKNGQIEQHDPDGTKTVSFGDGKYMRVTPDGKCEVKYKKDVPNDWPNLDLL